MEEGGGGLDEYLPEPGCEPFESSSATVRRLQRGGLMGPGEGMGEPVPNGSGTAFTRLPPKTGEGVF